MKKTTQFWLILSVLLSGICHAEVDVVLQGLMGKSAVLNINGQLRVLQVGKSSPEGVKLISTSPTQATIEIEARRQVLGLSQRIGANYKEAESTTVRLASQDNGHYIGKALINGRHVEFMVDTGASAVAMSSTLAKRLGLNYQNSPRTTVQTANGLAPAWNYLLSSISVGGIVVNQSPVFIIEGEYPKMMLLGNSFLSKVDMDVEQGVMVLKARVN